MSDIKDWSNDAGTPPTVGNQVPDYMPEGATPIGSVNDWGRETQAAIRRFYETFEWRDFGHTTTFATPTTFTVAPAGAGDMYAPGQRVRITDGSGTVYTTIINTVGDNITVKDTLAAPVTAVAAGVNPVGQPVAAQALSGTAAIDTVGEHSGPVNGDAPNAYTGTFTGSLGDGTTAVTQDVADDSDQVATTQHVTDKIALLPVSPFSAYNEVNMGETSFPEKIKSAPHGLGAQPKGFQVVIRCKQTDRGYAVGDEIDVTAGNPVEGGLIDTRLSVWASSNSIGVSCADQLVSFLSEVFPDKDGDVNGLREDRWDWVIKAWV